MEHEGALPRSQEATIDTCAEPDDFRPHPPPYFIRFILILASHPRLDLPSSLFPSGLPTKILLAFFISPIRAVCTAHLIILDLITLIYGEAIKLWGDITLFLISLWKQFWCTVFVPEYFSVATFSALNDGFLLHCGHGILTYAWSCLRLLVDQPPY